MVLAMVLALAAWGLLRLMLRSLRWLGYLAVAAVALWEGFDLLPTLLDPFVLVPLPATLVRATTIICLGTGTALVPLVFRLAERHGDAAEPGEEAPPLDEIMGPELRT